MAHWFVSEANLILCSEHSHKFHFPTRDIFVLFFSLQFSVSSPLRVKLKKWVIRTNPTIYLKRFLCYEAWWNWMISYFWIVGELKRATQSCCCRLYQLPTTFFCGLNWLIVTCQDFSEKGLSKFHRAQIVIKSSEIGEICFPVTEATHKSAVSYSGAKKHLITQLMEIHLWLPWLNMEV